MSPLEGEESPRASFCWNGRANSSLSISHLSEPERAQGHRLPAPAERCRAEDDRWRWQQMTVAGLPQPGSLQREWRRCSRPTCRCGSGRLHGPGTYR
jgi:hypothetical protein